MSHSHAHVQDIKTNVTLQDQQQKILANLLAYPENKECADCKAKGPRWASVNLGVFVCITCSGIHRAMGTHISKVRSVSLDKWLPEHVKTMQEIGNGKAQEIWEYYLPDNFVRPNESDTYSLERFIRAKYETREWAKKDEIKPKKKPREREERKEQKEKLTENKKSTEKLPTADLLTLDETSSKASTKPDDDFEFSNFVSATPSVSAQSSTSFQTSPTLNQNAQNQSSFNSEAAFFSGQTQSPKVSKQSILQLYDAPLAPANTANSFLNSGSLNQLSMNGISNYGVASQIGHNMGSMSPTQQHKPTQGTFKPNYNVSLNPLGTGAIPPATFQGPNYNVNLSMGASNPTYLPVQNPVQSPSYVNPNYLAMKSGASNFHQM